jgi:hypothetical protein
MYTVQSCKVPVNIYLYFYSYVFALNPFKFTYMGMKIFENTYPPYEEITNSWHTFHFLKEMDRKKFFFAS